MDLVYTTPGSMATKNILVSIFQTGYVKVLDEDGTTFKGVQYDKAAQQSIEEIYADIKIEALKKKIALNDPTYESYPRLPPDEETFRATFIDSATQSITNELLLKKRLTGLITYYKGSKPDFMPAIVEDIEVRCEMGEYILSKYVEARKREMALEESKKEESNDIYAIVEMFQKMKNPSSYKFRSRAICNFAFPKSIERPFPDSVDKEDLEVKPIEDLDIADRQAELFTSSNEDEQVQQQSLIDSDAQQAKELADDDARTEVALEGDEASAGVAAVVDAVVEPDKAEMLTYQELVQRAMASLNEQRNTFLNIREEGDDESPPETTLAYYSPKLDKIIRKIGTSPGSALVYSQFKTVEGLGVLGIALKANGYDEIRIEGTDKFIKFTPESEASIRKGPSPANKRFVTFSGEGTKEQRAVILAMFNGNFKILPEKIAKVFTDVDATIADKTQTYAALKNKHGEICKVIGISSAGAEGISLKCVRQVHIMEPYWNMVRLEQVKGRAIRICSHSELPPEERNVSIYTYVTYFSETQLGRGGEGIAVGGKDGAVDFSILVKDKNETSDEKVYKVSTKKQNINENIIKVMKEAAVDCVLNAPDNGSDISCFTTDETNTSKPMFIPRLADDKVDTDANIGHKPIVDIVKTVTESLGKIPQTTRTEVVGKVEFEMEDGSTVQYLIKPANIAEQKYHFFSIKDTQRKTPLGHLTVDAATGGYSDPVFY